MCDDIFEESDSDSVLAEKSWSKHVEDIKKDGYRQGLEAGQEECLQEGFNQAFPVATWALYSVAHVRGLISAKLSLNLLRPGYLTSDQESKLQDLLQDVLELETNMLAFPGPQFTDWAETMKRTGNGENAMVEVGIKSSLDNGLSMKGGKNSEAKAKVQDFDNSFDDAVTTDDDCIAVGAFSTSFTACSCTRSKMEQPDVGSQDCDDAPSSVMTETGAKLCDTGNIEENSGKAHHSTVELNVQQGKDVKQRNLASGGDEQLTASQTCINSIHVLRERMDKILFVDRSAIA